MKNLNMFKCAEHLSMENPTYSCLVPRSLVMTTVNCFYCGHSESRFIQINHLFGLKACEHHVLAAQRDCKAYMHEQKMVLFRDADRHPVLSRLLTVLRELPSFPVMRSSGEVQPGWIFQIDTFGDENCIASHDGEWKVPVRLPNPDHDSTKDLQKFTPIANFLLPCINEQIQGLPHDFHTLVNEALFCLIDGVYMKEYEEVKVIKFLSCQDEIPETDGVYPVQLGDSVVRVMIPGQSSAGPPQAPPEQVADPV
jgi:hypothetical protein